MIRLEKKDRELLKRFPDWEKYLGISFTGICFKSAGTGVYGKVISDNGNMAWCIMYSSNEHYHNNRYLMVETMPIFPDENNSQVDTLMHFMPISKEEFETSVSAIRRDINNAIEESNLV